jgi:hypothetical protein
LRNVRFLVQDPRRGPGLDEPGGAEREQGVERETLTSARVLVEEGEGGSHYAVAVEVPIEVVNTLAESALETQGVLSHAGRQAPETIRANR